MRARELTLGDAFLGPDREPRELVSLASRGGAPIDVYNLVVERFDTYFVGTTPVLVHSCDFAKGFSSMARSELRR